MSNVPWVDKYRPKYLNDIVSNNEVISNLKFIVKSGNMPHLILHGPSGTGKTSAILALITELFGNEKKKERVIELNASDDRGIHVVRHKIMDFVKSIIGNNDEKYPCPPFKIIILDEVDAMTNDAQFALRKMIETYSNITRFCFICNYINQIIEPLISRCVKFKFSILDKNSIEKQLQIINKKENLNFPKDIINCISEMANGDMRKSIMMLQNLKYIHTLNNNITIRDIREINNFVPNDIIDNIIDICIKKYSDDSMIIDLVNNIKYEGYPIYILIKQLCDRLINDDGIADTKKSIFFLHLSQAEKLLNNGANEYIQLLHLLFFFKANYNDNVELTKIPY